MTRPARVAFGVLLLVPAPTWAADCEPLDESAFTALVLDGQAAVDRGNPDTHQSVVDELRRRVPCLTFAPRPRVLTDFFVLDALSAFSTGGDWQTPLAAAIRIRPGVDRVVGDAHPMSRFEPPPTPTSERQPVPAGAQVFVDGEAAAALPPTEELHLVQVNDGGLWRSRLFKDEAVPIAFLTDPIVPPLAWTWWGHAGVAVGPGGVAQRRDPTWVVEGDQVAFTPNLDRLTVWPALVARGGAAYGLLGVTAELDVGLAGLARPVGSHAQFAIVVGTPAIRVGGGAGVGGSTKVEGVNAPIQSDTTPQYTEKTDGMPYVFATATHVSDVWDAGLSAGFGPAALRASLYAGLTNAVNAGQLPLRLGVSGSAQRGWFTLGEVATDEVTTVTWRAGLELGVRR